jgi:hypothetical protein
MTPMADENEQGRNFSGEAAAAMTGLQTDRGRSVGCLREIEEAWARSLLRLTVKGDIAKAVATRIAKGLVRKSANRGTRLEDSRVRSRGCVAPGARGELAMGDWQLVHRCR